METKQTIHNTLQSANAFLNAFENRADVKELHDSGTNKYSYVVKHPTENKWAIRWNTSGKYWNVSQSHMSDNSPMALVDITEDWKNTEI